MEGNLKVLVVDNELAMHGFVRGAINEICPHPLLTRTAEEGLRLARVHHSLASYDSKGFSVFSGTSGATPQVTAAVANVISVLSDLTKEEAKVLLQKTAVPIGVSFQVPQMNGAGMLNTYKLAEVAKRLKQRGWPAHRTDLLSDPSTFDFSRQAKELFRSATNLLASGDCTDRRKGLHELRRSFLLDSNTQASGLLATQYASQGLFDNSQFYKNFDRMGLETSVKAAFQPTPPDSMPNIFNSVEEYEAAANRMKSILALP